ncbi:MAG: glycosyltransferase family 9 protein [Bacteroidales bacterium]|nr:glycosyltransferase family 9 protein [Bacteroidales bacterium]
MKKILLIRFSSIGDIVLVSPVIRALKTQLKCELHVLTKNKYRDLYVHNPYVDKVHVFEKKSIETIPALKTEHFDFIVDLQKNLRSSRVKRNLKLPSSSFPKLNVKKWLLVNLKVNRLENVHIVDRYFHAVEGLGVKKDNKGLDFFLPKEDFVNLKNYPPLKENAFVGLVIGGQHKTKMFPPEKTASVVSRLPWPVVLLGGPEDRENGETIRNLTENKQVMNACGELSLNESASLVRQAGIIITNDTGLMHIAAAFKKPIISIWGNTVPEFGMYPYEPGNEEKVVIAEVKGLKCRPCSKIGYEKCPKKHFKCMMDQDEDFIVKEALRLFPALDKK